MLCNDKMLCNGMVLHNIFSLHNIFDSLHNIFDSSHINTQHFDTTSSLLWSDPVGARQMRAKALRRRAPLDSGWLQVARGGSGACRAPYGAVHARFLYANEDTVIPKEAHTNRVSVSSTRRWLGSQG